MADEIVISMSADDKQVDEAFNAQAAEIDKLKQKLAGLEKGTDAVGRSYGNLSREARAVLQATQTPLERLLSQQAKLNLLAERGLITEQQRAKAYQQNLDKYHGDTGGNAADDRRKAAEAKAAADAKEEEAKATRLANEAEKEAARVYNATRTPLEKLIAARKQLADMRAKGVRGEAGGIDQQTFERGVNAELEKYQSATGDGAKAAAKDTREIGAAAVSTATAVDRLAMKLGHLSDQYAKGAISKKQFQQQSAAVKTEIQKITQATSGASSGIAKATGDVGKFVLAFSGIGTAAGAMMAVVAQVRREYENLKERQKTAADKNIDLAKEQAQAVRNLGGLIGAEKTAAIAKDISRATGKTEAESTAMLGAAAAAAGATEESQVKAVAESVKATASFAPELSREDSAKMAASTFDVQKRLGGGPEEAIGFGQLVGGLAHVTSLGDMAKYGMPAVMKGMALGATPEESGSLFGALTQSMADTTGTQSGTAQVKFIKQMRDRFGEGSSLSDSLEKVWSDPKLKKQILEGGGRGKFKKKMDIEAGDFAAIEGLLTPGSMEAKAFTEGKGFLGDRAKWKGAFDDTKKLVMETPSARLDETRRVTDAAIESAQAGDVRGAITAEGRRGIEGISKALGASDIEQKLMLADYEFGAGLAEKGGLKKAADQLRQKATARLATTEEKRVAGGYGEFGENPTTETVARTISEEDRRKADAEKRLADFYEKQQAIFDKMLKAAEDQAKTNRELLEMEKRKAARDVAPPARRPDTPIPLASGGLSRTGR